MDVVARWTGRHGLALAEAMRLPREVFARKLGISPRTMADWAKAPAVPLALKTQELLDVMLDRGSDAERRRFAELLQSTYWPEIPEPHRSHDAVGELVAKAAAYQDDTSDAVSLVTDLASADAAGQISSEGGQWVETAGPGAIAGYLFGGAQASEPDSADRTAAADRIQTVAHHLMDLDFELGGGVVRRMLSSFFNSDVAPLLRRQHPSAERREIFRSAAVVMQQLGWSAYDGGAHGLSQGYYTQGLRLAAEAGDRRLAGYLLSDLSHQANYLGQFSEALRFARAAKSAINGWATPTQTTAALAMEARALASLGERQECIRVIGRAEKIYEQYNPGIDPLWISYFTPEEFAGERLHCFTSLGMKDEIREFSALALGPSTPARTRTLIEMITARGAVQAKEPDEAISRARGALAQVDAIASSRSRRYYTDFEASLVAKYGKDQRVIAFLSDVRRDYPSLARAS